MEMALLLPVVLIFVLGITDFGLAVNARLRFENEVSATQFKLLRVQENAGRLSTVVQEFRDNVNGANGGSPMMSGLTVDNLVIEPFCVCPTQAAVATVECSSANLIVTYTNTTACSTSCPGIPYYYYAIRADATYDLPFTMTGFPSSTSISVCRMIQVNGG